MGVFAEDWCQRGAGQCPGPKATRRCHSEQTRGSDSGAEGSRGAVAGVSRFAVMPCSFFSNAALVRSRAVLAAWHVAMPIMCLALVRLPRTLFFFQHWKRRHCALAPEHTKK